MWSGFLPDLCTFSLCEVQKWFDVRNVTCSSGGLCNQHKEPKSLQYLSRQCIILTLSQHVSVCPEPRCSQRVGSSVTKVGPVGWFHLPSHFAKPKTCHLATHHEVLIHHWLADLDKHNGTIPLTLWVVQRLA